MNKDETKQKFLGTLRRALCKWLDFSEAFHSVSHVLLLK